MGMTGMIEKGQMTVELAVAFPVLMIVAAIAVNAMLFFSECAAFDRCANEAVRTFAASPAYGQTSSQSCGLVESALAQSFDEPYLEVCVSSMGESYGHVRYDATLEFSPTLFGMGMRDEIFGVSLPKLVHSSSYVIDPYKPGVVA